MSIYIYIHMYAYHIYHALTSAWPLVTADNGSVMAAKVLPFHALSLEKKNRTKYKDVEFCSILNLILNLILNILFYILFMYIQSNIESSIIISKC